MELNLPKEGVRVEHCLLFAFFAILVYPLGLVIPGLGTTPKFCGQMSKNAD
jgi:hypothetical protein